LRTLPLLFACSTRQLNRHPTRWICHGRCRNAGGADKAGGQRHEQQWLLWTGTSLELEAVDSLISASSSGPRPAQPEALRRAVRALRSTESSLDFQAALLAEQRRVALRSGYTG
jgi:hypothetical protein